MRETVGRSHQGKRDANEDSLVVNDDLGLFLVADGMGGHRGGAVASRLVAETVADFVEASHLDSQITWPFGLDLSLSIDANRLRNAVQLANQRVRAEGYRQPDCEGMGSTVVAVLVRDDALVHVNVGDSRLYLLRNGALRQLTADDSWVASMLRAGADEGAIRHHPMRHLLTRVLGVDEALNVEVSTLDLQERDLLALCSDGLHGPLTDPEIERLMSNASLSLAARADALVDAALAAGGSDNISVVLVRLDGSPDGSG